MTALLSPFNGKTIVLELGREIGFKAKQELIKYLREQQARIAYMLTANTDYILVTNNIDNYKIRRAKQLGLPLINVEYVYEYRRLQLGQPSIDITKFIITSVDEQENFTKTGTIVVTGVRNSFFKSRANAVKSNKFDFNKIKLWNSNDANLPLFDELTLCEIGKWAIFKVQFYSFSIAGGEQQQVKNVLIQYALSDDPYEQQQLFASYYYHVATMPHVTRIREILSGKLGSKLLLRVST
ncbi:unnamed protein product [Rotaria sp. Silwood1]|nr:unnamed protein product [Rotaria sp. Silwood1]